MPAEIYAVGEGAFVAEVANSLALLTQSSGFIGLSMIGFTLGVLVVGVQSVMSGGREFKIQNILIAIVAWMVLFGSTVQTVITDVKSGQARVVDNVPIGVAYAGQIVSSIGYNLTSLFETAFSTPSMLEDGYAKDLKVMKLIDRLELGSANSTPAGIGDRTVSLRNYLETCTLTGVDTGDITTGTLTRSPDLLTDILFSNVNTTVEINLAATGGAVTETCAQAHQWLVTEFTSQAFSDQVFSQIATAIDVSDGEAYVSKMMQRNPSLTPYAGTPLTYINNVLIRNNLEHAIVTRSKKISIDNRYAVMMEQSIAQRQVQWKADKDWFVRLAGPLMTFFEGIMYAAAPLLAFMIAMGPAGFGLVIKYMVFAFWVQSWAPVMAITNLFVNMAFTGRMDSMTVNEQVPAISMLGMERMAEISSHWDSIGSMLIAATPFITLMLMYGGTQAATSLMSRVQGQDHVNEKIPAPDIMQTQAKYKDMNNQIVLNSNTQGMAREGTAALSKTLKGGMLFGSTTASSEGINQSIGQTFANEVMAGSNFSADQAHSWFASNAKALSQGSSNSRSGQVIYNKALSIAKNAGIDNKHQQEAALTIAGILAAGAGNKGEQNTSSDGLTKKLRNMLPSLNVSAQGTSKTTNSNSVSDSIRRGIDESLRDGSEFKTSLSQALNEERRLGMDTRGTSLYRDLDSNTFKRAASTANSREKRFQEQENRSASFGSGYSVPMQTAAASAERQGMTGDLVAGAQDIDSGGYYENLARLQNSQQYQGMVGEDGKPLPQLKAQAALQTLYDNLSQGTISRQPGGAEKSMQARDLVSRALEGATGASVNILDTQAHQQNSDVQAPSFGFAPVLKQDTAKATRDAEDLNPGQTKSGYEKQAAQTAAQLDGGTNAASPAGAFTAGFAAGKSTDVQSHHNEGQREAAGFKADKQQALRDEYANQFAASLPERSGTTKMADNLTSIGQTAMEVLPFVSDGITDNGYEGAYQHYHNKLGLPEGAAQAAAIAASGEVPAALQGENFQAGFLSTGNVYARASYNSTQPESSEGSIIADKLGLGRLTEQNQEKFYDNFMHAVANRNDDELQRLVQFSPNYMTDSTANIRR